MRKNLLIVCLLSWCLLSFASAQELKTGREKKEKYGMIVGYGDQTGLAVKYNYQVYFFQFQYYRTFYEKGNLSLELLLQPQVNLTYIRGEIGVDDIQYGSEIGLNVGFLARKTLQNDRFSIYSYLGVGPHYVSHAPARQIPGFLFSDNLFVGITYRVNDKLHLDFRPGFRHISNANLASPNGGVNTGIISGGIMWNVK